MCKGCNEEKTRWVDLSGLPRWRYGKGQPDGVIDWKECANQYYKVKFKYDDIKGEVEIVGYESKGQKVCIKYLNKPIFEISTSGFIECRLGTILGKITSDFKIKIGQTFKDDKRDITIIDKKYENIIRENWKENKKIYGFYCNKCSYKGWAEESSLLNAKSVGCPCCCPNPQVVIQGINDIPTTSPWMVKYFQGGYDEAKLYTKATGKRIFPICPDCGRVKNKSMSICDIYRKHSIGCNCNDNISIPNKVMYSMLEQLKIKFITEYSPNWIKPKRYDFYFELNNKEYIIEMDGVQHKKEKSKNSVWQSLKKQKENDSYKDKLAEEHGIKVIRIDCEFSNLEFIKNNILKSELNDLFDLSNIDWLKCEEFALSNLCKKACEMKRDNPEMTTTEIGKILNLDRTTIINYLKNGSKVWEWCEYSTKEEMKKSGFRNCKMTMKLVEILNLENESLGVFPSCAELGRQSKNLFGVKLNATSIADVARGRRKTHKGFTFKYVETNN